MGIFLIENKNTMRAVVKNSDSCHIDLDRKVMLDCRHYRWYELEEEEKTIFDTGLSTIGLYLFDHTQHHSGMIAWMNTQLVAGQFGMSFKSDSLSGIVSHDVLEHLILSE